jgi:hypothetical protein
MPMAGSMSGSLVIVTQALAPTSKHCIGVCVGYHGVGGLSWLVVTSVPAAPSSNYSELNSLNTQLALLYKIPAVSTTSAGCKLPTA